MLAALLGAGCASSGHHTAEGSHTLTAQPSPTHATASCADQAAAWRTHDGERDLTHIGRDLNSVSKAGNAGNLGALQAATLILGSDAQIALHDLPPACIRDMSANYATALNDFVAADQSAGKGDTGDIEASNTQIRAGGEAIARATRDLTRWEAQQ